MRDDWASVRAKGILTILIFFVVYSAGCIQIPSPSSENVDMQHEQSVYESIQPEEHRINLNTSALAPDDFPAPEETPSPIPTPLLSNVSNWNPYSVLPTPTPALNHTSILKNNTPNYRKVLNTTYSGSVGLAGFTMGKDLNITTGPFAISYTVHPNISSPLDVWVKLTVFDPWQNVIAIGGYNRGYPNQETQTMTLYREGRYYLSIEGDFASIDYSIKTGDPVPISTQTQTPVSFEGMPEEEMMREIRGL